MSSEPEENYMKSQAEWDQLYKWIDELKDSKKRENSLIELCRARSNTADLAKILWSRPDTFKIFQEELVTIFSYGNPSNFNTVESIYVRHILYLLHCVAFHPVTQLKFLNSQFIVFLYPYLNMAWNSEPFEPVRHGCLDIISILIAHCEKDAIELLLTTEFIPIGLRIMEFGSVICKWLTSFIVYKMLMHDMSFMVICQNAELVEDFIIVLKKMLLNYTEQPISYVKRCLRRFTDNETSRTILREQLKNFKYNQAVNQ